MFENLLQSSAEGHLGLWGLFLVLVACGLGLPLPEDVVLVAAGLLSAKNGISLIFVMILMYVGILLGDSITYALGRYVGQRFLRTRFGRWVLPEDRIRKAEELVRKNGSWIVGAARFMPGLRAPTFFTTGLLKFSYVRFLFADGLAALLSAPVFVFLGHWAYGAYSDNFDQLKDVAGRGKLIVLAVVGVAAAVGGIWLWRNYRRRSAAERSSSRASS